MGRSDLQNGPFGRIELTILLFCSVSIADGLRGQGNYLSFFGMDHSRLKDLVMEAGFSLLGGFGQATGTAKGIGRKILAAIDNDQVSSAQDLIIFQVFSTLEPIKEIHKYLFELSGFDLIQIIPELSVGGYIFDLEKALKVIAV